jgi:hypothetical protein
VLKLADDFQDCPSKMVARDQLVLHRYDEEGVLGLEKSHKSLVRDVLEDLRIEIRLDYLNLSVIKYTFEHILIESIYFYLNLCYFY